MAEKQAKKLEDWLNEEVKDDKWQSLMGVATEQKTVASEGRFRLDLQKPPPAEDPYNNLQVQLNHPETGKRAKSKSKSKSQSDALSKYYQPPDSVALVHVNKDWARSADLATFKNTLIQALLQSFRGSMALAELNRGGGKPPVKKFWIDEEGLVKGMYPDV
ncbi:Uu.00g134180.m01.CDS01 [Anthostomella pinea]|uniref:Uu.00g134180.m01.CDS01 n=1 Tax=Anthostomella pinea TaxID=933095 RepID=A0AAI8VPJ9_9PEZI|nr:Uu.00g134180.m01.CDS01 [Anthostomella pinea]